MAAMHLAGEDFEMRRVNALSVESWRPLLTSCGLPDHEIYHALYNELNVELGRLENDWPTGLPSGVIHADMFPDNVFFLNEDVSGIIDFYYAHHTPLIYDLAVCIADWCFVLNHGELALDNARAIVTGYRQQRNISPAEAAAWTKSLELAGLRFYLSRLHDKHFPRPGAITQEKDPDAFLNLIKLCRENPAELNSILGP